jgi:hypothetical protein
MVKLTASWDACAVKMFVQSIRGNLDDENSQPTSYRTVPYRTNQIDVGKLDGRGMGTQFVPGLTLYPSDPLPLTQ